MPDFNDNISVLCAGIFVSLKPIVLVDMLGLEKLSHAFGVAMLFQGIGAFAGPPLAGLFSYALISDCNKKKLRYRRGTARRAMSVEILSTAAPLYEKSHLKGFVSVEKLEYGPLVVRITQTGLVSACGALSATVMATCIVLYTHHLALATTIAQRA